MRGRLRTLPIGTYHFEKLRRMDCVYVDKTARLTEDDRSEELSTSSVSRAVLST